MISPDTLKHATDEFPVVATDKRTSRKIRVTPGYCPEVERILLDVFRCEYDFGRLIRNNG